MENIVNVMVTDHNFKDIVLSFSSVCEIDEVLAKLIMAREKLIAKEEERFAELKENLRKQNGEISGNATVSDKRPNPFDELLGFSEKSLDEQIEEFRKDFSELKDLHSKMPEGDRKDAFDTILGIFSSLNDFIEKRGK